MEGECDTAGHLQPPQSSGALQPTNNDDKTGNANRGTYPSGRDVLIQFISGQLLGSRTPMELQPLFIPVLLWQNNWGRAVPALASGECPEAQGTLLVWRCLYAPCYISGGETSSTGWCMVSYAVALTLILI